MEAKPYPEGKRKILIERPVEDFASFLKGVTDREANSFIQNQLLPRKVAGFRDGRAPLTRKVQILISKLKKERELTNCDSHIWDLFKNAWICWVGSHQELNDILDKFDNGEDFDENRKCVNPPNSELDLKCFEFLLEASHNNKKLDQETIQHFYEWGYFNEDEQIQNLIDQVLRREEVERRQRIDELPDQVDKLCQEIAEVRSQVSAVESENEKLRSQVSAVESENELQKTLDGQIREIQQSLESQLSALDQRITDIQQSVENQASESNFTQTVSSLRRLVNSLKARIDELERSLSKTQHATDEFSNNIGNKIAQLEQQIHDDGASVEGRLEAINSAISEIKSEVEARNQKIDAPRIARRALKIGETFAAKLEKAAEHYENEQVYLEDFEHILQRFGVTDCDETAAAIHVALKAFPVLEIADSRIFKVWKLMCDEHFLYTKLFVEMGWFGLQDWFPKLFADECFGEQLERIDLEISIQKMLDMGKMPWAIHFRDCDRSFPECYLPRFMVWIKGFSEATIKVFLTRCSGTNRCEINEDAYTCIARLPEPQEQEPIEARNLRSSGIIVTHSDWESWCCPNPDIDQNLKNQFDILDELRSTIEQNGVRIPITPLREIRHYLQLSQSIEMAPTSALDWGLTLRLLPWIGNRPEVIDSVLSMPNLVDAELSHFCEGLQTSEKNK